MRTGLIGVIFLAAPLALLGCEQKENDTGQGFATTGPSGGPGGGGPGGGSGPGGGPGGDSTDTDDGGGPGGPGGSDDTGSTGSTGSTDSGSTDGGTTDTEPEPEVEYGPENSWFHAMVSDVPVGLEGTGYRAGDIAYNFTLQDQFGQEVELYQFYGQVIVLDAFAEW